MTAMTSVDPDTPSQVFILYDFAAFCTLVVLT